MIVTMKPQFRVTTLCLLLTISLLLPVAMTHAEEGASWGSRARALFSSSSKSDSASLASTEDLANALREALAVSAERALTELGQTGGFLNSEQLRIPLPKAVERFRKPFALVDQEYRLDEFQATMNRAAEQGVAAAPGIVQSALQELTLDDLNKLWKGKEDAITRFLEQRTRAQLSEKMLPLIATATDASGATRSYKQMEDALPEAGGGLFGKLQSLTGLGQADSFDLDNYVNDQALDGLFNAMAAEEKAIREDPLARSTDLLKEFFGN